jgi:hypothetical protein
LRQTSTIKPAFLDTAPDGPTIRPELTGAHLVVAALMMKDEETYRPGLARNQRGVHDEKLGVRHGYAKIAQAPIQHRAHVAAA